MKQYGWITGPVECRCTVCDWSTNFIAVDSSIPVSITNAFASHDCADYTMPFQFATYVSDLGHDD
jgi:hypothetical protein